MYLIISVVSDGANVTNCTIVTDVAMLTVFTAVTVKKLKSPMARSLPVENLLPQNVGSIINYLQ